MKDADTPKSEAPAPTHLRLSKEMDAAIIALAEKLEISKQEALRLALRLGLDVLKSNGYDASKAAITAAVPGDTLIRAFQMLSKDDPLPLPVHFDSRLNERPGKSHQK